MTLQIDSDLLHEVRQILVCPSLNIQLDSSWGSESQDHRQRIHQALALLNPKASSISHTEGLGGFVSMSELGGLGFDLELSQRVSPQAAGRVCYSSSELALAPSPASLWVAKEAAYKALRDYDQPLVLSAVEITEWAPHSHFETFHFIDRQKKKLLKTLGLVWSDEFFHFAIARVLD